MQIGPTNTVTTRTGDLRHAAHPVIQRLPEAAEALEVALTAGITVQEQAAITQGGLRYQSDKGSRVGNPPKPSDQEYNQAVLGVGRESVLPDVYAVFRVHWQGNKFGEIGGAYVQLSLPESSEFHEHGSSLDVHFTCLDTMPKMGDDPKLWPMQWTYEGNFDPLGPGQYAFNGKFEIDAFGGFKSLEHVVVDHSALKGDPPTKMVRHGTEPSSRTRVGTRC